VSQFVSREAEGALVCYEAGNEDSLDTVNRLVAGAFKKSPDCKLLFVDEH
jgi:hypothetical protein